jgi:hypothetical protein
MNCGQSDLSHIVQAATRINNHWDFHYSQTANYRSVIKMDSLVVLTPGHS